MCALDWHVSSRMSAPTERAAAAMTAAGEIGIEADITARTTAVNERARLDNVMGAGKSGIDDSARRGQQLELHDIEVEFFSRIILNGDASTGSRTKHIISRRQRGGGDSDPLRGDGLTGVDGDIAFLNSVVRGGRCRIARAGGAPRASRVNRGRRRSLLRWILILLSRSASATTRRRGGPGGRPLVATARRRTNDDKGQEYRKSDEPPSLP